MTSPERALAEPIRAGLRQGGAFGRVVEPESLLAPSIVVEASVTGLYGDFRQPSTAAGAMEIHFIAYRMESGEPGRIVFDKFCSHRESCARRTPEALMAAWQSDLGAIMREMSSAYAEAHTDDR